ncbi:MAG TPA: nucleotidyltransferase family protein [Kofleriaceae bacterium]|nr:nucleotidyltransferase family protein [Kofleriaceae bacterium]
MTVPGAVIVAAGAGRRLGGVAKALLPTGGPGAPTFLAAILATARAVGLGEAVVVVGPPFGDAVARHAEALGAAVVVNPAPERGMASSIALGFAALADGAHAAAWLWPVDHPWVAAATLHRLLADAQASDAAWIQPRYQGAGGHPPLIRRALWPALAACGDAADGARGVLRGVAHHAVEVDDPGVVRDLDTWEAWPQVAR